MLKFSMEPQKETTVHPLENPGRTSGFTKPTFAMVIGGALVLGVLGGFVAASFSKSLPGKARVAMGGKKNAGIADKKLFPDQAEGKLKEGGIDGEGNFHLERPGGESQNVYLTSSTVDLSQFLGKKIRVWGQTFEGQKAGWLMDVGYVESL